MSYDGMFTDDNLLGAMLHVMIEMLSHLICGVNQYVTITQAE